MEIFFTNLNVSFGFANRIKYDFISMRGRIWCFFHINQFRVPFPDDPVQIPRVNYMIDQRQTLKKRVKI